MDKLTWRAPIDSLIPYAVFATKNDFVKNGSSTRSSMQDGFVEKPSQQREQHARTPDSTRRLFNAFIER
jgi:hypothetical protein